MGEYIPAEANQNTPFLENSIATSSRPTSASSVSSRQREVYNTGEDSQGLRLDAIGSSSNMGYPGTRSDLLDQCYPVIAEGSQNYETRPSRAEYHMRPRDSAVAKVKVEELQLRESYVTGVTDTETNLASLTLSNPGVQRLDNESPTYHFDLSKISYLMKVVRYRDQDVPIICQSTNGACPILSIANFLSLSDCIKLPAQRDSITADDLTHLLAEFLLSAGKDLSAIEHLEDLHKGLNVNPKFTGVDEFVEGHQVIQTFGAELVHGWIPDLADSARSYLMGEVETRLSMETTPEAKLFTNFEAAQMQVVTEPEDVISLAISTFLQDYPNNLTGTGLTALHDHMYPGELSILFYNSHLSLLHKHPCSGDLYTLVTDTGYLESRNHVVWESLVFHEASQFYTSDFVPRSLLGETMHDDNYGHHQPHQESGSGDTGNDAAFAQRLHDAESGHVVSADEAIARRFQEEEDANAERSRQQELAWQRQEDRRRMDEYNGVHHHSAEDPNSSRTRPSNDRHSTARKAQRDDGKKDCIVM